MVVASMFDFDAPTTISDGYVRLTVHIELHPPLHHIMTPSDRISGYLFKRAYA